MYLEDLKVHLPVTNQYKHLDGLLDSKSNMAAEARRRLSMATQAFDKGKQLVYLNRSIPLGVRANVLQTAVTSTYHSLGIWAPKGKGWTMLRGTRLVRKLLSRQLPGDAIFRLPASVAHVINDYWLPLWRLSLVASMCSSCGRGKLAVMAWLIHPTDSMGEETDWTLPGT